MDGTEGLVRGQKCIDTGQYLKGSRAEAFDSPRGCCLRHLANLCTLWNIGSPIRVPVGVGTLGRIMNVTGDPIDDRGEIKCQYSRLQPLHVAVV